MKKLFTLFAAAVAMLSAQANDYTGTLNVNINGADATPTKTTITINKQDKGTYDLQLKNFTFVAGEDAMPVGTINIKGVVANEVDGSTMLFASQDITIENGDDSSVGFWAGPMLGEVPVEMVGELKGDKFHTVINIDFTAMEMAIAVEFTTGNDAFQLPNSGFENYHTATYKNYSGNEANGWHNFLSGQGTSYLLGFSCSINTQGDNYSTEVRPGSLGEKSLLLLSKAILSIPANGTATTGRMNVGSMTATDASNYSFNDMSMTDVDANGDPFYAVLSGQPDSLTVWVKFAQNQPNADYPYATVSAVINDGTEYRDPDTDASNAKYNDGVVAKAVDKEIATGDWRKLSIPFDYDSYAANNAETKAILVTFSTNAVPGQGSKSGSDSLYVDDIALVYNAKLASLKYNGADVDGFSPDTFDYTLADNAPSLDKLEVVADGRGAKVYTELQDDEEDGKTISITVISADLKTINTYELAFPQADAIREINANGANTATEIYNAAGQRISTLGHGINIVRQNGKTVKVVKK